MRIGTHSAKNAEAYTPADVDIGHKVGAVYVGTAGALTCKFANAPTVAVTFANVPAGQILQIQPIRVTVGGNIVLLW